MPGPSTQVQVAKMPDGSGLALLFHEVGWTPVCLPVPWPPPEKLEMTVGRQTKLAGARGGQLEAKTEELVFERGIAVDDMRVAFYIGPKAKKQLLEVESAALAQQVMVNRDAALARSNGAAPGQRLLRDDGAADGPAAGGGDADAGQAGDP